MLLLSSVSLQALTSSPALDEYLAQADCLRALFVALNDESKDVRATAVQLVGRLASWNPAYVAPALRRHLLQLLTDMDNSPDSKQRDDSAYLINCLINSAPQLIMPYVSPIQKVGAGERIICVRGVAATCRRGYQWSTLVIYNCAIHNLSAGKLLAVSLACACFVLPRYFFCAAVLSPMLRAGIADRSYGLPDSMRRLSHAAAASHCTSLKKFLPQSSSGRDGTAAIGTLFFFSWSRKMPLAAVSF
jgi:hypothetical protein